MLIIIITILGLTIFFSLIARISPVRICPICAAVVLTWVSMIVLILIGYDIDRIILTTLIAMSIGALATKYGQTGQNGQNLVWKTALVVFGLPMVWYLVNNKFGYAFVFFAAIIFVSLILIIKINNKKGAAQADRFKDCC